VATLLFPTTGLGGIPTFTSSASIPIFTTTQSSSFPVTVSSVVSPVDPGLPTPLAASFQSLPPKLTKKILDLEFIEMAELLPESWRFQEEEGKCCHQRRGPRKGPVNDILVWVECYSSLVTTLASKFPQQTPHFMAYLKTIVKAHRSFIRDYWVTYDTCFCWKATVSKSLDWGVIDFTLYNETFTGRAKAIPRCKYCSSDLHPSSECVYAPSVATSANAAPTQPWAPARATPLCQLFNGRSSNRCTFNPCKFEHACSACRGRHPVSACRRNGRPSEKRPREDSPHYHPKN